MAVSANLFVTDSLVGSTQVKNTFANISVGTIPLAFIGDQSFVVRLRRNSTEGDVIATTPQITIRDNAALVSFVANTYTVAEGDLVKFTLTTTGAPNNAVLFYSTAAVTANVRPEDFVGANTGSFALVNNVGTIVLRANTDGSLMNETGETFKLQIRTGSVTGNVVLVSDNVAILDTSNISSYFISQTATSVTEGSNVTFSISSVNVPNGTEVFYTTAGNVRSYNFTTGNTGSRIIVNGSNTINLIGAAIPSNETRQFALQIREGSSSGQIKSTSQNVTVSDTALLNLNATGGNEIIDSGGFRTHIFISTSNLSITSALSPTSVDLLLIAGGGGGGVAGGNGSSGGGAGGLREITHIINAGQTGNYTMTVGAGGGSTTSGSNSSAFSYISSGGGGAKNVNIAPPISPGSPGGSGAGGGGQASPGVAGLGNDPPVSPPQGNPGGGPGQNPSVAGGGGGAGGAGRAGGSPTSSQSPESGIGSGGIGKAIPWIPASYGLPGPAPGRWFAGGGGGGGSQPFSSEVAKPGGAGGGGSGAVGNVPGNPGTTNTGGGGGGGSTYSASPGGIGGSGIIAVRYAYTPVPTLALTEDKTTVPVNQNIRFGVVTTNFANNYVLYYRTSGNVISTDFVQGNTGSVAVVNNAANITLTANAILAQGEERVFVFQILEGAIDGDVILVSNTITVTPPPVYLQATGGIEAIAGGYKTHAFLQSNIFTIFSLGTSPDVNTIEYTIVAGGGASSDLNNTLAQGGGGGGGIILGNIIVNSTVQYNAIVGAGGSLRSNGANSEIFNSIAIGGGAGGGGFNGPITGFPGGSGGGSGGAWAGNGVGGAGVPLQGYPGGNKTGSNLGSAGGGGAGQAGGSTTTNAGAPAGNGISISWVTPSYGTSEPAPGRWFAGGGGGFSYAQVRKPGGFGGGGAGGSFDPSTIAGAGNVNTGGGGGGWWNANPLGGSPATSGFGGSGIVIIRYPYQ